MKSTYITFTMNSLVFLVVEEAEPLLPPPASSTPTQGSQPSRRGLNQRKLSKADKLREKMESLPKFRPWFIWLVSLAQVRVGCACRRAYEFKASLCPHFSLIRLWLWLPSSSSMAVFKRLDFFQRKKMSTFV